MKTKKSALGRGLSAILESPETDITSSDISGKYVVGAIANIHLSKIEANPFQPRNQFEENALLELAESIRAQGIVQPITVRKVGYDGYQLISGERRLRASRIAGLETIPCFIRIANDQQMLEMALIENIHRENLNPVDIAISYQRLIEECNITQEILSERIGKDRSTISNYIRLLRLPAMIQVAIREGKISMGHARTLIAIEEKEKQIALFNEMIEKGLSVRDVEKLVRNSATTARKVVKPLPKNTPQLENLTKSVSERLQARVTVRSGKNEKGEVVIKYRSPDDLQRILAFLDRP